MPDKWAQYAQPAAIQPTSVQKTGADPWQQYAVPSDGGSATPTPTPAIVAPAGNTIGAAPPRSQWQRTREMVANSAVGHSLESFSPKLADTLGLTPTETVNSPTYESDRQQLIAPQYGRPNVTAHSAGDQFKSGVLTGAGKLTSGNSIAQGTALAATGGLLAPAAAAAPILKTAGALMGGAGVVQGVRGAAKAYGAGKTGDAAEQLGETVPNAAMMLPLAAEGAARVPELVRSKLAGDLDAPIPMTNGQTPATRFQAAKRVGVNLNAADATNAPLLEAVRRGNEGSAAGSHIYAKNNGANTAAWSGAASDLANAHSTLAPETAGSLIQSRLKAPFVQNQNDAYNMAEGMSPLSGEPARMRQMSLLKENQEDLHTRGSDQEQAIRDTYGDQPIASYDPMRSTAKTILQQNAPVDTLVPHLAQKQTRGIVQDIANLGKTPSPKTSAYSLLDEYANPGRIPAAAAPPPRPTVGNLLDMRSRLLDVNANNPELVKGSAAADIDRQIAATHQAIERSLPPEGNEDWLKANEVWKDMKDTYDNPSSPYYHAIRGNSPNSLTEGIGGTSPEALRAMQTRVGDEGMGIVRRGVADKLFGHTPNDEMDLKGFPRRLQQMPEEERTALFDQQHEPLLRLSEKQQDIEPYRKDAYDTAPEKLVKGVGDRTGSGFRDLAPRIGPEGVGAMQRAEFERLLGSDKSGQYNLPTFGRQLNIQPDDYHGALFGEGPGGTARMHDLATTANTLTMRPNTSGTAHSIQKNADLGSLVAAPGVSALAAIHGDPVAAAGALLAPPVYNAAQYGAARLMNSPRFVNWLMTPKPNEPFFGGSSAAAAMAGREDH